MIYSDHDPSYISIETSNFYVTFNKWNDKKLPLNKRKKIL